MTAQYPVLSGLLCRILLYTSLAYNTSNTITLEFSTPRFVVPNNMLFCFNRASFIVSSQTFVINYLQQGGSIFSMSEAVVAREPLQAWRFFTFGADANFNAAEFGTVYDILGTDPYYSRSYTNQRYDDITRDQQGNDIRGVVDFPFSFVSKPSNEPPIDSNCFMLSGDWQPDTRYQMEISFTNPPAPGPPPPAFATRPPAPPSAAPTPTPAPANGSNVTATSTPAATQAAAPVRPASTPTTTGNLPLFKSSVYTNSTPILWLMPLTYSVQQRRFMTEVTSTAIFNARGNKYGAACTMRDMIKPVMSSMFDACDEANKEGLGPARGAAPVECINLLQAAVTPNNTNNFPFNAPPVRPYNLLSFDNATCDDSSVLGPRLGGECIKCEPLGVKTSPTSCACPPNMAPALIGSTACIGPLVFNSNASDANSVAAALCRTYTGLKSLWKQKQLFDRNIASLWFNTFASQAGYILDWAELYALNQTFYANFIFDDRYPDSPTRVHGVQPNCNRCTQGYFQDYFDPQKAWTPVFDSHFDAMNMLRFIGYALYQAQGYTCTALWDPARPRIWDYGFYEDKLCQDFPAGTIPDSPIDDVLARVT